MPWYEIHDPAEAELDRLAAEYHLHPLHVEDCRHRNQRAKIEESEGYIFIVLKTAELKGDEELEVGDVDIFLGRDFLITVHETECQAMLRAMNEIRARGNGAGRLDMICYRVMDSLVDTYLPILDHLNEQIDSIEDEVLEKPSPEMLERIFGLKRALIELRRILTNMRDVAAHLQRTENKLMARDLWPFLRDIYDHVARNLDAIEMQRDLLTGSLDIYLSSVANRTNQVMKVLTVLGTVALPSLVISSFYGMNVKGLPWADANHAVAVVIGAMALTTGLLLWVLKRFGWF
jgi:magnesium transporter